MQGQNAEANGIDHHSSINPSSVVPVSAGGSAASREVAVTQGTGESAALISMIARAASDPNVDIEKMERLFQMHERMTERAAKTAFLSAFSKLQSALPSAIKGGTGHNKVRYARYEDLIEALRPVLVAHGFSLSHRVDTSGDRIKVTGILGHEAGHAEETQFAAPPDTSGNKSAIHAIASTISYGKRYVTLTLTGIATEGEDDDAKRATSGETITEEQAEQIKAALDAAGISIPQFAAKYKLAQMTDLPASRFDEAMRAIAAAAKKRSVQ